MVKRFVENGIKTSIAGSYTNMGGAKHEFLVLTLCDFIFSWTFESTYKRIWDFLFLLERCCWGHLRPKYTFLRLKETIAWKSQYLVKGKCLRYETRIMSLILIRKMTPYQQIRNVLFPSLVNAIFEQTNPNTFSENSLSRMNLNHRGPQRKKKLHSLFVLSLPSHPLHLYF